MYLTILSMAMQLLFPLALYFIYASSYGAGGDIVFRFPLIVGLAGAFVGAARELFTYRPARVMLGVLSSSLQSIAVWIFMRFLPLAGLAPAINVDVAFLFYFFLGMSICTCILLGIRPSVFGEGK